MHLGTFREELRAWLKHHEPEGLRDLADWNAIKSARVGERLEDLAETPLYREWEARLSEAQLICPQWPESVGGQGLSTAELAVLNEEFARAGLPRVQRGMGESLVGPSIIVHGTEAQKSAFLPRIISGEDRYCQGFSEPDHGSDLASVTTTGVVDGDDLVIHGTKVWTSRAVHANVMFLLCRTDHGASRHHGLSFVIVPMRDNGIEVHGIRDLTGTSYFCQEFIDGARAPLFNVIGGLNNGWRVAMTTLGNERAAGALSQPLAYGREFWELVELVRSAQRLNDPLVRQELAKAYTRVEIMRYSGLRLLSNLSGDENDPGPASSVGKLFWSEHHQAITDLALDVLGLAAVAEPVENNYWQDMFLWARAGTIYSGTSEVQRNIVAERTLGLPRQPEGRARVSEAIEPTL